MARHSWMTLLLFPLILGLSGCSGAPIDDRISGDLWLTPEDGNDLALLKNPTSIGRLTSAFGYRRHPITGLDRPHRGIDLAAPTGTPVRAAETGVLLFQGERGTFGNFSSVKHGKHVVTAYAHLDRFELGLVPGMHVEKGQVIGYVGSSGRSSGPHLHYEILLNGERIDPLGQTDRMIADSDPWPAGKRLAALQASETVRSK